MMMAMPKEHNFALFIISQSILYYILHCYNVYYCHRPQCSAQSESIVVRLLLLLHILLVLLVRLSFHRRKVHSILSVYFVRCYRCIRECVCFSRDAISPEGRKTQVLASNFQVSSIVRFQFTTAPCTFSVYIPSTPSFSFALSCFIFVAELHRETPPSQSSKECAIVETFVTW